MKRTIIALSSILVLWLLIPVTARRTGNEVFFVYPEDTVRCAIALDHSIRHKGNRNVGFHYELLGAFGRDSRKAVMIDPPADSPQCWEMLMDGSLQILVFDSSDTIPDQFASSVFLSQPIKGGDLWAVRTEDRYLLNSVNVWFSDFRGKSFFRNMKHRYYRSYSLQWLKSHPEEITSLSPYDELIKRYSELIGIDWRLLSAIIYQESKFSMGASSSKSAKGLMQIKESTAAIYGIDDIYNPESNIKAGTMHFDRLVKSFRDEGLDSANVIKFALATYNAGESAIAARRKKAAARGFNPNDWEEVSKASSSALRQITAYIDEVLDTYATYRELVD